MKQYIYGKNAVLERMKQGKEIASLYLSIQDVTIEKLAKQKRIYLKKVNKSVLDDMLSHSKHQGIVALIESYQYTPLEEIIQAKSNGDYPLIVMLDGLEDPHNLGAILRTCDAIGVDGVIIGKHRNVSLNATVAKVSTGAIEHVKVAQVTNLTQTIKTLKKHGYWIVGTAFKDAVDYRQVDYKMPLVLVIGSEGFGISPLVLKQCDFKVYLPMVGHVTSLNASVAAAILLYQVYNNRHPLE